ncbi:WEB family protein At5g55860-like isoform X1 [Aristolochia californica]|uniref:WEB family protein At5g55860-like isoform X1 n=1 Tax=Aristolochia californica TaxID=171875 RepID=UPI0035DFA1D8
MGEVDSKPFESVQAALSLFGQKTEQRKYRSTRNEEVEKEIELDLMQKELSGYKVQLEIKESAHMQALLELEVCSKKVDELSTRLNESENEREKYIVEYKKTKSRLDKLESENTHLLAQLFENDNARGSLQQTLNELKTAEEELKAQLAASNEAKVSALTQVELMETAREMNKEKIAEFLKHVSELNEAILFLKLSAIETDKEKTATLFSKDEAIEKAYEQIEEMKKELDRVEDLENKLLTKNLLVETLELELKQAKGIASDAMKESETLKIEIEQRGQVNSEREIYVQSIEMQLHQSRQEVQRAQQVANDLNCQTLLFKDEIHKVKSEMAQVEEKESMAKLEIATLNSELHRARSKLAAAEAAELRAESIRSGLYLAVQELAMEAEAAKQDTQRLKQEATGTGNIISSEFGSTITISMEEYETLTREAKVTDDETAPPIEDNMIESSYKLELEKLKLELGAAKEDIDNLVVAAGQAKARAEMAEKAKTAVEDQLRKYRERKEKKRAAIIALKEESSWWSSNPPVYDNQQATYQSLGKVLNMKF